MSRLRPEPSRLDSVRRPMRRSLFFATWFALLVAGCGGSSARFDPVSDDAAVDAGELDDAVAEVADDATDDAIDDATGPDDAGTAPPDYAAKGPFAVVSGTVNVAGRPARIHAPNAATPPGGWPAVVFAHGFMLKTTDYDDLLTHVTSWGWVVLSVDYPGSFVDVDHRAVRDAIVAGGNALVSGAIGGAPKIAPAKVAAAGHSLGGKGAIMAVLAEDAFAAALAIDPVDGNPSPVGGGPTEKAPQLAPTQTAKLAVPVAYFGATQSRCAKPPAFPGSPSQPCAPEALDAAKFFDGTPGAIPRYLWTLFDFGHMQLLDNPMCGTSCDACVAGKSDTLPRRRATKALTVAFLVRHVEGDASAEPWLAGATHDELVSAKALWDGKSERPPCP